MDTHEKEKLRLLIQELAQLINAVLVQSPELRSAIQGIEEKGYRVDLILASMTRILKKNDENTPEKIAFEPTESDKKFLKAHRICWDSLSNS
ncbi:MAG TPA: hypothetical protein VMN77_11825 [Nitrospiria bacterium]|jgi:hypothetical protein|nr:hypothetical protein [Nitrospiria bacterium]